MSKGECKRAKGSTNGQRGVQMSKGECKRAQGGLNEQRGVQLSKGECKRARGSENEQRAIQTSKQAKGGAPGSPSSSSSASLLIVFCVLGASPCHHRGFWSFPNDDQHRRPDRWASKAKES
jgi:hypothetical protein